MKPLFDRVFNAWNEWNIQIKPIYKRSAPNWKNVTPYRIHIYAPDSYRSNDGSQDIVSYQSKNGSRDIVSYRSKDGSGDIDS